MDTRHPRALQEVYRIAPSDGRYPGSAGPAFVDGGTPSLSAIGDAELLRTDTLGLLCSIRCTGDLILKTYDIARLLGPAGPTIVSGFHSPMERQCLDLFLARHTPVIMCPARSIDRMRIPSAWRIPIAEGRMLILTPFNGSFRRPSAHSAEVRNRFVVALADRVLIPHATAGGKTARLATLVREQGKVLLTFHDEENRDLLDLGASLFDVRREKGGVMSHKGGIETENPLWERISDY